jgi:hypothetical protein
MMIDLLTLPAAEAERLAYAEGFTMAAELFARIAALEVERDALARELEELEDKAADDSLARWERDNGPADAYRQFFDDCFDVFLLFIIFSNVFIDIKDGS